tara:strand:+ start:15341 stop:16309 length:969 start_codon:yes stop_codon:yes gene_type:complete
MKKVLVTGITGQDGIFLTNILLQKHKEIEIIGVSRNAKNNKSFFKNLNKVNNQIHNLESISLVDLNLLDLNDTSNFIQQINPDYVVNLSGPSSVYKSFNDPLIPKSISTIFNNLTTALIENNQFPNFYQASSSEIFKESEKKLNEQSEFDPKSPYAVAKFKNHNKVFELREKYDWNIISGIMFNHESEFRKNDYLIMQIIQSAIKIKNNKQDILTLGSTSYIRDWSYSEDIANAIYQIVINGVSGSYVIGSGVGHKIADILDIVFNFLDLDWKKFVNIDESLLRTGDPVKIISDPHRIINDLSWKSEVSFEEMVMKCLTSKL